MAMKALDFYNLTQKYINSDEHLKQDEATRKKELEAFNNHFNNLFDKESAAMDDEEFEEYKSQFKPYNPSRNNLLPQGISHEFAQRIQEAKSSESWERLPDNEKEKYNQLIGQKYRELKAGEGLPTEPVEYDAKADAAQNMVKEWLGVEAKGQPQEVKDLSWETATKSLGKSLGRVPGSLASTGLGAAGFGYDLLGSGLQVLPWQWTKDLGQLSKDTGAVLGTTANAIDTVNRNILPPEQKQSGSVSEWWNDRNAEQKILGILDEAPEQFFTFVLPMLTGNAAAKSAELAQKGKLGGWLGNLLNRISKNPKYAKWFKTSAEGLEKGLVKANQLLSGTNMEKARKAGTFLGSSAIEASEMAKNAYRNQGEIRNPLNMLGHALLAGKLESLVPEKLGRVFSPQTRALLRRDFGKGAWKSSAHFIKNLGKDTLSNLVEEGLTELTQTYVEQSADMYNNKGMTAEGIAPVHDVNTVIDILKKDGVNGLIKEAGRNERVADIFMATLLGGITGGVGTAMAHPVNYVRYNTSPEGYLDRYRENRENLLNDINNSSLSEDERNQKRQELDRLEDAKNKWELSNPLNSGDGQYTTVMRSLHEMADPETSEDDLKDATRTLSELNDNELLYYIGRLINAGWKTNDTFNKNLEKLFKYDAVLQNWGERDSISKFLRGEQLTSEEERIVQSALNKYSGKTSDIGGALNQEIDYLNQQPNTLWNPLFSDSNDIQQRTQQVQSSINRFYQPNTQQISQQNTQQTSQQSQQQTHQEPPLVNINSNNEQNAASQQQQNIQQPQQDQHIQQIQNRIRQLEQQKAKDEQEKEQLRQQLVQQQKTGSNANIQGQPLSNGRQGFIGNKARLKAGNIDTECNYAVVELADLQTLSDEENPRLRNERQAYQNTVSERARNLDPDLLIDNSVGAQNGPIVVDQNLKVESGNGRTLSLREAYANRRGEGEYSNTENDAGYGRADLYRNKLIAEAPKYGISSEQVMQMQQPVLVRIRVNDSNINAKDFYAKANNSQQESMSSTETALVDGEKIKPLLKQFEAIGDIRAKSNLDFVRSFLERICSPYELNSMFTADGRSLSEAGEKRINNAIIAAAYGNSEIVSLLTELGNEDIQTILNGLAMAAPDTAKLMGEAQRGEVFNVNLAKDLADAIRTIKNIRQNPSTNNLIKQLGSVSEVYLRQGTLGDDGLSPTARLFIGVLGNLNDKVKISNFLKAVNNAIRAEGSPNQLGMFEPITQPTDEAFIERAIKNNDIPTRNGHYLSEDIERLKQGPTSVASNDDFHAEDAQGRRYSESSEDYRTEAERIADDGTTASKEEFEDYINSLNQTLDKNAGISFEIYDSAEEFNKTHKNKVPSNANAFYSNGKIVLIRDNIKTLTRLKQLAAHELIGHVGIKRLLGGRSYRVFLNSLLALSRKDRGVRKLFKHVKSTYADLIMSYSDSQERTAYELEELGAHLAELYGRRPERFSERVARYFNRLRILFRNALRNWGIDIALDHNDLRDIFSRSYETLERNSANKSESERRYSKRRIKDSEGQLKFWDYDREDNQDYSEDKDSEESLGNEFADLYDRLEKESSEFDDYEEDFIADDESEDPEEYYGKDKWKLIQSYQQNGNVIYDILPRILEEDYEFTNDPFADYDDSDIPAPVQALLKITNNGEIFGDLDYYLNNAEGNSPGSEAIDLLEHLKNHIKETYHKPFANKIIRNCNKAIEMISKGEFKEGVIKPISIEELEQQDIKKMPQDDWETRQDVMKQKGLVEDSTYWDYKNKTFYSLAGEKARNANIATLDEAKQLLADGKDKKTVWKQTGWYMAKDGKPRFEISDKNFALNDNFFEMASEMTPQNDTYCKLDDIVDHEQLFNAYPHLRDLQVRIYSDPDSKLNAASYDNNVDINIRDNSNIDTNAIRNSLIHELQHAIQKYEGFAVGSSPAQERMKLKAAKGRKHIFSAEELEGIKDEAQDRYRRHYGEGEARTTSRRVDYNNEDRSRTMPEEDFDYNVDNSIVDFGEEMRYSLAGKKARTANIDRLYEAQRMLADGEDKKTVWQKTGWYIAKDGKPRFEIADDNLKLLKPTMKIINKLGKEYTTYSDSVRKFVKHDKLFEAYPFIGSMDLYFTNNKNDDYIAYYSGEGVGSIHVNIAKTGKNVDEIKSALIHEIQHAIQNYEGFAKGSSVENEMNKLKKSNYDNSRLAEQNIRQTIEDLNNPTAERIAWDYVNLYREFRKAELDFINQGTEETFDKLTKLGLSRKELRDQFVDLHKSNEPLKIIEKNIVDADKKEIEERLLKKAYDNYHKNYGEGEARAVENRLDYADFDRDEFMPEDDFDYNIDESVISGVEDDEYGYPSERRWFSLSSQSGNNLSDEEYQKAVKEGRLEDAEKMADSRLKEKGYDIEAYHGTGRADRVRNEFRKERATSGPMSMFTSDYNVAKGYSESKADTSLDYENNDYYHQYRVDADGGLRPIGDMWDLLPERIRRRIWAKAKHICLDDEAENIVFDQSKQNGLGNFRQAYSDHNGNVINALIDSWLESGDLFGEEERFSEVLKLAGITDAFKDRGWGEPRFINPDYREEKVYKTRQNIKNPFNTSTDFDNGFIDRLAKWWSSLDEDQKQSYDKRDRGNIYDLWNKNNWTFDEWVEKAEQDIKNGTTNVFTSIPDFVTDFLKSENYDGIVDQGGKHNGYGHTVYIPFESNQIKERGVTYDDNGNLIPLSQRGDSTKNDIRFSLSSNQKLDLNGEEYSVASIEDSVKGWFYDTFESDMDGLSDTPIDIKNLKVIGSRAKGNYNTDSDLDVVLEYDDPTDSWREDDVFNMLNEVPHELNGVKVDINPIKKEDSGTIEEWLDRNYDYDKNEELKTENGKVRYSLSGEKDPSKITSDDVIDLLERVKQTEFDEGTYIPVRANTPKIIIETAKNQLGMNIPNLPMIMQVKKAFDAMEEKTNKKASQAEKKHTHGISPYLMGEILEKLDKPNYIFYQRDNGYITEFVTVKDINGKKIHAIIDFYNVKPSNELNGYYGGVFNVVVTLFDRDKQSIEVYRKRPNNVMIYSSFGENSKGASSNHSGNLVPSYDYEAPSEESITENSENRNPAEDTDYNSNPYGSAPEGRMYSISPVWTGSAADYDQPSTDFINTGEGAQVFGWGLYASSSEGVGRRYAEQDFERKTNIESNAWESMKVLFFGSNNIEDGLNRINEDIQKNGEKPFDDWTISALRNSLPLAKAELIDDYLRLGKIADSKSFLNQLTIELGEEYYGYSKSRDDEIVRLQKYIKNNYDRLFDFEFKPDTKKPNVSRNLYKQTAFAGKNENLLDWYEPVSNENADKIREALRNEYNKLNKKRYKNIYPAIVINSGESVYKSIKDHLYNINKLKKNIIDEKDLPRLASEFLYSIGIDGIKYPINSFLDNNLSYDNGFNIVVFNEKDLHIDEHIRYSLSSNIEQQRKQLEDYVDRKMGIKLSDDETDTLKSILETDDDADLELNDIPSFGERLGNAKENLKTTISQLITGLIGDTESRADRKKAPYLWQKDHSTEKVVETPYEISRRTKIEQGMKTRAEEDRLVLKHLDADKNFFTGLIRKITKPGAFQDWMLKKASRILAPFQIMKPVEQLLFTVAENIMWDEAKQQMVIAPYRDTEFDKQTNKPIGYKYDPNEKNGRLALDIYNNRLNDEFKAIIKERSIANNKFREDFVNRVVPYEQAKLYLARFGRKRLEGAGKNIVDGNDRQAYSYITKLKGIIEDTEYNELISQYDQIKSIPDEQLGRNSAFINSLIGELAGNPAITTNGIDAKLNWLTTNKGLYGYAHHLVTIDPETGSGKPFNALGKLSHPWIESIAGDRRGRKGDNSEYRSLLRADLERNRKEAEAESANRWMEATENTYGITLEEAKNLEKLKKQGKGPGMPDGYENRHKVIANFGKFRGKVIYLPDETFEAYQMVRDNRSLDSMKQFKEFLQKMNNLNGRINEAMLWHPGKAMRDLMAGPFHLLEFLRDWSMKHPTEINDALNATWKGIKNSVSPEYWQSHTPESLGEYSESVIYQTQEGQSPTFGLLDSLFRYFQKAIPVGRTAEAIYKEINFAGAADIPLKRIFTTIGEELAEKRGLSGQERERFIYDMVNDYAFDTGDLPEILAWLRGKKADKKSQALGMISRATVPFMGYATRMIKQMITDPVTKGAVPLAKRAFGNADSNSNLRSEVSEFSRPFFWLMLKALIAAGLGGILPPPVAEDVQDMPGVSPSARTHGRFYVGDSDKGERWMSTKGLGQLETAYIMDDYLRGKSDVIDFSSEFLTIHPVMKYIANLSGLYSEYDRKVPFTTQTGKMLAGLIFPELTTRFTEDVNKLVRAYMQVGTADRRKQTFIQAFIEKLFGIPAGEVQFDKEGHLRLSDPAIETMKMFGINIREIPFDTLEETTRAEASRISNDAKKIQKLRDYRAGKYAPKTEREFLKQDFGGDFSSVEEAERAYSNLAERARRVVNTATKLHQKGHWTDLEDVAREKKEAAAEKKKQQNEGKPTRRRRPSRKRKPERPLLNDNLGYINSEIRKNINGKSKDEEYQELYDNFMRNNKKHNPRRGVAGQLERLLKELD